MASGTYDKTINETYDYTTYTGYFHVSEGKDGKWMVDNIQ